MSPSAGDAHGVPWRVAREQHVDRCHYCRTKWHKFGPPTLDHVIPRQAGGTLGDGYVLACQQCNAARGHAPFEEYCEVVRWERIMSFLEDRPFRRPKYWTGNPLTWRPDCITTLPPWARKQIADHPYLSPRDAVEEAL